jgi:type VI secretion system protein ImpA
MSHVIDIDDLLQEFSPESPCGENMEYDPDFMAMEQASRPREEQQVGDSVLAAEAADWPAVKSKALELLRRTKDLRVAVYLTRALVAIHGVVGLRDGLALVQAMLERSWDNLHPNLDPEDGNDPTIRVNTLLNLCGQETMLPLVREVEVASAKGMGRFTFRDYLVAAGKLRPGDAADAPPPEMSAIEATFLACDLQELQERGEAALQSLDRVAAIETTLMNKVGPTRAVGLEPITDLMKDLSTLLSAQLARRGAGVPDAEAATPNTTTAPAATVRGEVNSREDVIRALDKACEYFQRNEPSSPVPLLLKRAKNLMSKDFLEIVRDLAPGGVQEIEKIRGPGAG